MSKRIVIAGATGYLGQYLVKAFHNAGYEVAAITRSVDKLEQIQDYVSETIVAEVTEPHTIQGIMKDAHAVISCVGITRQKDGYNYMDVDYKANKNLLDEAMKARVRQFMYVSVLNGKNMTDTALVEAKERFVDELEKSSIRSWIIRPSGFFSDMKTVLQMAHNGRVYFIGNGKNKVNPIDGQDLAEFCVETFEKPAGSYDVGGPEVMTLNEIAKMSFRVVGKKTKIMHVPKKLTDIFLWLLKRFTGVIYYGPIEFFMKAMTSDMVGPIYGKIRLEDKFTDIYSAFTGYDDHKSH